MIEPLPFAAGEVGEYALSREDARTPLIEGGEVLGVFVNALRADETRRFLAKLRGARIPDAATAPAVVAAQRHGGTKLSASPGATLASTPNGTAGCIGVFGGRAIR